MNITWSAKQYKENFAFVPQYGNSVAELIDFSKAKTAIDLGCGNGTLTALLKEKGLLVTGVDASEEMIELAKKEHPDIAFRQSDATEFTVQKKVDVIFSNAVFHWIDKEKQQGMLRHISNALNPGGQLVFEFGGYGCGERVHSTLEKVFAEYGYDYQRCFYFPTIGEYAPLVEKAGLIVKTASLFDRPTPQKGENGLKNWIKMFVRTPFEIIPDEATKEKIINETVDRLNNELCIDGVWYIDYVRIRMRADKPDEQQSKLLTTLLV